MTRQIDLFGRGPGPVNTAAVADTHRGLASRLPPGLRLGTSSWSFPGWAGVVWDRAAPARVLARHGLRAYARHPLLRTVCVDRTYYRPVTTADWREYAEAVPDGFRFLTKAERVLVRPEDPRFLDAEYAGEAVIRPYVEGVGDLAGPVLFQFPPFPPGAAGGARRFSERLFRFLDALPPRVPYAVELRTPGLMTPDYAAALHHAGASHGYVVHPRMLPLPEQLARIPPAIPAPGGSDATGTEGPPTPRRRATAGPRDRSGRSVDPGADHGPPPFVLRWMLRADLGYEEARDLYEPFDRLVDEDPVTRARIGTAALEALAAGRQTFVVANNKAEGSSPLSIIRLAEWLDGEGHHRSL